MKLTKENKRLLITFLESQSKNWHKLYIKNLQDLSDILNEIEQKRKREDLFNKVVSMTLMDKSCTNLVKFRNLLLHYGRYLKSKEQNKQFPQTY